MAIKFSIDFLIRFGFRVYYLDMWLFKACVYKLVFLYLSRVLYREEGRERERMREISDYMHVRMCVCVYMYVWARVFLYVLVCLNVYLSVPLSLSHILCLSLSLIS